MIHELKVEKEYFDVLRTGDKSFEIRKNDRNYREGDTLILWECSRNRYTGRYLEFLVSYIFFGPGYGLEDGYCVMSLRLECSYTRVHRALPYDKEVKGGLYIQVN